MRRHRPKIPGPRVRRAVKRNTYADEDDVASPDFETREEIAIGAPSEETKHE